MSFDLVERPWLLARTVEGHVLELSLVDIFRRAGELSALVGDVPTQVFALTRMLLAVLHGATKGPAGLDHWERLWRAPELPLADIESYLDGHRERFDLVHPITPFMQVAGLRTAKGEVSDLSKLIADVPNGHRFFSNRLGPDLSLTLAEAARWLVHCHAFDPSGIKSGALGDDRVKGGKGYPIGTGWSGYLGGVLPEGSTLRETLLLNLLPRDLADTGRSPRADRPSWEREPDTAAPRPIAVPTGPVDLFTWQSRRVRLVLTGDRVTGVLICNGDQLTPQNMHNDEVHTAWRRSEPQEKKLRRTPVYMPLEHRPERLIWRGLQAMLPVDDAGQRAEAPAHLAPSALRWLATLTHERVLDRSYPVRVHTIGMAYGSQSSTTAEIVDDMMSLQAELFAQGAAGLRRVARLCVAASEDAARALGGLAANLAEAAGGDIAGPRSRAVEQAYAALDPLFRDWLRELGPGTDPTDCQITWHQTARDAIRSLGRELVRGAPPVAMAGRLVNNRLMTTVHAELWFGRNLRKALELAYVKEEKPA